MLDEIVRLYLRYTETMRIRLQKHVFHLLIVEAGPLLASAKQQFQSILQSIEASCCAYFGHCQLDPPGL